MIKYSKSVSSLRTSEIRDLMSIATRPDIISFAGGMPGNELFPVEEIDEIYNHLPFDIKQTAFQYGPTPGYPPLLESLKEYLKKKGMPVETNRLMITTGSLQAINILGKVFIDPGDLVVTENPCFIGGISAFKSYQAILHGIDLDRDGINVPLLKSFLDQSKSRPPKFIYLTPNFHNPAGTLYTEQRKKELVPVLQEHDLMLVEDDAYGELYFDEEARKRVVPMKTLYEHELDICYTGTFSKILGPGFRLGWMLVPQEIYQKAELCKQSMDACSPNFTQVLANEFLRTGKMELYIIKMREVYKRRKDTMAAAIRTFFPEEITWLEPKGGFYIWLKLPPNIDITAVLKASIEKGAVFVIGKTFDPEGKDNSHIRLAYSHTPEHKIERGIQILGACLKEALKRPA
ncbi:MAG: PLP-dependent aminotransferase family protein [Ignavibacteriae bacterium]|nr:MAG: PLP-dependent aminotransferase family protein [Ignavibacteriota bacterium]